MTDPVVTDHAVIRYLERVLKLDMTELRVAIAASCRRHQGAPSVKALGGHFLIRDGRVVTVVAGNVVPHYEVLQRLIAEAAKDGGDA